VAAHNSRGLTFMTQVIPPTPVTAYVPRT